MNEGYPVNSGFSRPDATFLSRSVRPGETTARRVNEGWHQQIRNVIREPFCFAWWIFSNCIALKMYAMFSNDCGLVLTGHEVYTDRFTQDGNRRSLYRSLSAIVTQKMVTCEISVPSYKQRHFAVNEKWLTTRFVFLHINREIFRSWQKWLSARFAFLDREKFCS